MSRNTNQTLLSLPIEVIHRILDHLDSFDILISLHGVCAHLDAIIDNHVPYQVTVAFVSKHDRISMQSIAWVTVSDWTLRKDSSHTIFVVLNVFLVDLSTGTFITQPRLTIFPKIQCKRSDKNTVILVRASSFIYEQIDTFSYRRSQNSICMKSILDCKEYSAWLKHCERIP